MTDICSALLFLGFVSTTVLAAWKGRASGQSQQGVRLFLAYAMVASTAAGLLHHEFWPFARWQIFAYRYQPPVEALQVRAVDAQGTEYDVDRHAWEPLSSLDLHAWLGKHLLTRTPAQQEVVGRYLLDQVNTVRARVRRGEPFRVFQRFLGPLSASLHILYTPIWSAPEDVPTQPFTGLRIYRDRWDVWARARDPQDVQRTLLYAYTQP